MKSVVVVSNMYPSGASVSCGVFVKNCVEILQSGGFEVKLVTLSHSRSPLIWRYASFYLHVFSYLVLTRHDAVYAHYASHVALPILAARLIKKLKLVTHVHGSDVICEDTVSPFFCSLKTSLSKILLLRSDLVVVPSAYFEKVVCEKPFEVESRRVHVSPSGGFNGDVFYPKIRSPKKERGVSKICFVGRLTDDKGVLDFLELVRSPTFNCLDFSIIGHGPLTDLVVGAASDGVLRYLGELCQPELADILRMQDLLVFPTKREAESLGLVGLEAMACGVPVIAYDAGGPATYIIDDINSWLVPRGDLARLKEKLLYVVNLPSENFEAVRLQAIESSLNYKSSHVGEELIHLFRKIS